MKAYEAKKGMTIKMSKTNGLQHENRRRIFTYTGWIDPILNGNCFTNFRSWSLIRTGNYGCSKTNGLYLKKGDRVCQIETEGRGLYLGSVSGNGFETVGNGLYLMKQGGLYDGRELILGPNSPFKKKLV